ncbi:hypothetical protein IAT38_006805 [Cryptococcus sp. DSM 104549]
MGKPSGKALGKRKASGPASKPAPKKSKPSAAPEVQSNGRPKRPADQPKKVKLRDQKYIPVPTSAYARGGEDDEDDSDAVEGLGEEDDLDMESAGRFLVGLDTNALSRSAKETKRLHDISKSNDAIPQPKKDKLKIPVRQPGSDSDDVWDSDPEFDSDLQSDIGSDDSLGSLGSEDDDDDDDDEDMSSDEDQDAVVAAFDDISDDESVDSSHEKRHRKRKEEEAEYEVGGRSRWTAKPAEEEDSVEVGRLPIKLPTGEVQMVKGSTRIELPPSKKPKRVVEESEEEIEEESEDEGSDDGAQAERMAGQKGKFGRMGIAEIVGMKGWKNAQRLEAAKEQVAGLGAEILAGGELVDIGPVLTRLSSFGLPTVPSLEENQPSLPVPASIRGLVFLSQLAVYKDLIPGYRIRALTAQEETEKVRDEVRRLREGEKMLVRSYKGYLKMLEQEIKGRSNLASLSLKCMADLLTSVTHFNFSENIMGVLVGRLGRRSWDSDSDLVLQSFISVFRADLTGVPSQTLVRLIARMIKERHYQVHPNVLFCLLHLRLRDELDAMRRGKNAKGPKGDKGKGGVVDEIKGKKFKSETRKKWATKNQKKKEKEMKELEKEMQEAEAEVDKEERAQVQTETLKNMFVLYFSILKNPVRTPLLPAALEGISTYAHLINVDFFRDLLVVLRKIMDDHASETAGEDDEDAPAYQADAVGASARTRIRLLAIVTAFDLLSGQGEALNIDLTDFINHLFALLRPLSLDTGLEDPPALPAGTKSSSTAVHTLSTASLLFRCLHASFFARHSRSPAYRYAAFAKRLTECALHLPPKSAGEAVTFARMLVSKEPKVEGLLDTEERMADGVYRPEMDDPQLVNPFATSWWEAGILGNRHWDRVVRNEMSKLRDGKVV